MTNFTRTNFARAVIEGTVVTQVAMLEALAGCGLRVERLMLIGGAAASIAVQTVLAQLVDVPVVMPEPDEYVTKGAAMQAASALTGSFPTWPATAAELPRQAYQGRIGAQHRAAMAALGYQDREAGARA